MTEKQNGSHSHRLDLADYTDENVGVLAGRDRGKEVREKVGLDKLDKDSHSISVIIPEHVYSVNSSFLLGLFGPSIRALGEIKFRAKYLFEGPNADAIIGSGIRMALLSGLPLPGIKRP